MNMHREVDLTRDYRLTAWFYDSLYPDTSDYGVLVAVSNPIGEWYRGLGLTWAYKNVYIYIDVIPGRQADIYPTAISRTLGWHNATVERVDDTLNRYIDDVLVNSAAILPGESQSQVQLATHAISSSTYWDYVTLVTPLDVAVSANPATGVEPLDVSFTSTVSGGVSPYTYAWSFGDGGTSDLASPMHTYATPGTFTASVTVEDSRGESVGGSTEVSVSPDASPPAIAITSPADGAILPTSTITVRGTAADNVGVAAVEASGDGGTTWVRAAGTTTWSATLELAEGSHEVLARAIDTAANMETAGVSVIVDLTEPVVSLTAPTSGAFLRARTVQFSWTTSDAGSGLDRLEATLDGGTPRDLPATAASDSFLDVSDGMHTINLRATDRAGHATSASVSFTVDATPPSLAIVSPSPGTVATVSAVTVVWTSSDPTSGIDHIEIRLDGGPSQSLPSSGDRHTYQSLADGSHTVRVTVFDKAGNTAEDTLTFQVDTSLFSPSGPYGSAGLAGVFGVIIAIVLAVTVLLTRRARSRPPGQV